MNILDLLISIPGAMLRWFNDIAGNQYVLALLIFAFVIEIILLPFSIKQQKNSIRQAKMRPKEMAIRKKYAGREDQATKQKMSMEIQEMYQKEGFNPMSGCLPLLIQFPIIIALYNIVMNPLKYICGLSTDAINGVISVVKSYPEYADKAFTATRNIDLMGAVKKIIETDGVEVFSGVEGFSDHIASVADIPNLTMFGGAIDLGGTPEFTAINWLLLVPVLTFVAYFLSMKVNRKLTYQPAQNDAAMGCSNKVMDFAMPLMSVFITFGVPAALGVYWIFKCLIGMLKQFFIHLAMPIPKMTDEELKAAEKEYNAKAEKAAPRASSGKKVRSLHYIDAEDDEPAPAPKTESPKTEETEAKAEGEANESEGSKLLGQAPIKEDKPHEDAKSFRSRFRKKANKEDSAENTENTENTDNTDDKK
ncbi:MAG: membrane protein insertase YidC [Clostridia bacterium]|nr:membrane protein insertase YidC [Clostridia bacterium]